MEIRNLKKVYNPYGIHPKVALNGLDFEVEKGDFICIMGASGSGKTTLVNILSTIDEAQNQSYPILDSRVADTYAKKSIASSVKALYDSYIKAFRWASDRIDNNSDGGVIAFISNGAWLDGSGMDGMRKCLENEFSTIYVLNLRGNQRTSGELSRKEGGKIFGSGSRTPISITFLVKNPAKKGQKATIFYHDIGDYLTREQKLRMVKDFRSITSQMIKFQLSHTYLLLPAY